MAGSSKPNGEQKVIFELNSAKKLLYLKYDSVADVLYVSTLNNVYECLLGDQDFTQSILYTERCRIISRNLVSARGLYLDAENRNLYVVDHKKREVKKIELKNAIVKKNVNSHIDQAESLVKADSVSRVSESRSSLKSSSVFLNQQILPTLGDVFYMCIYNRSSADLVIWSEFSGKKQTTQRSGNCSPKVFGFWNKLFFNFVNFSKNNKARIIKKYLPQNPSLKKTISKKRIIKYFYRLWVWF